MTFYWFLVLQRQKERQFDTCQPVDVRTDDSTSSSGEDNQNATIVQQISPTASTTAIVLARISVVFGRRNINEMQFLYEWKPSFYNLIKNLEKQDTERSSTNLT